jgi:hypothetical protein
MRMLLLAAVAFSSCAGLTGASIVCAKKMDGRINSGHDGCGDVLA